MSAHPTATHQCPACGANIKKVFALCWTCKILLPAHLAQSAQTWHERDLAADGFNATSRMYAARYIREAVETIKPIKGEL